jgi:hypothetical protein
MNSLNSLKRLAATLDALPTTPATTLLLGEDAKRAHEQRQDEWLPVHLECCGVPEEYRARVVAGLKTSGFPAVQFTRDWVKGDALFLVLCGANRIGKSTAAAAVLKMARDPAWIYDDSDAVISTWRYSPRRGMFVSAVLLSDDASWSDAGRPRWERARRVPWLVIDDLGAELANGKSTWMPDLQDLVIQRNANGLRTVLTANLGAKACSLRYGSRVWSRIQERGVVFDAGAQRTQP